MKGSIVQRKSFIRTFVKQIAIDYPNVDLEYTIPLPVPNKETPSNEEVLSLQQFGSPSRIFNEASTYGALANVSCWLN